MNIELNLTKKQLDLLKELVFYKYADLVICSEVCLDSDCEQVNKDSNDLKIILDQLKSGVDKIT